MLAVRVTSCLNTNIGSYSVPSTSDKSVNIIPDWIVSIPFSNKKSLGWKVCLITWTLGLSIPKDREKCYIRVKNQYYHWKEGEDVVFDDT